MIYTLLYTKETQIPHCGLRTEAFYGIKDDPLYKPHKIILWHRHAPKEIEADVICYKLDGIYVWLNKNGSEQLCNGYKNLTREVTLFCPKTTEGLYYRGWSPQEQIAYLLTHKLKKQEMGE